MFANRYAARCRGCKFPCSNLFDCNRRNSVCLRNKANLAEFYGCSCVRCFSGNVNTFKA